MAACSAQPEFEGVEEWDRTAVRLPQFRVETWGPFVFVNQDPEAPPLAEALGAIPRKTSESGCPIDDLQFSYRRDYEIQCNWKVYIDNYLEGYHLPAAHPSLYRELDYQQYRVDTYRYYSSQIAPIRARSGEPRRYQFEDAGHSALYYWLFPNFMLNIYPDNGSCPPAVRNGARQCLAPQNLWAHQSKHGYPQSQHTPHWIPFIWRRRGVEPCRRCL